MTVSLLNDIPYVLVAIIGFAISKFRRKNGLKAEQVIKFYINAFVFYECFMVGFLFPAPLCVVALIETTT